MNKINEENVEVEHRRSPKGTFELFRKHISIALGGKQHSGTWDGGHPFDVELTTLPPGKKNYPFHSHAAQWEYYIILSGEGRFLSNDETWHAVQAGDHIVCPPGEAHQIENNSEADLVYYVIADHYPADVTTYPHTGKRQLKPELKLVNIEQAKYYDGEE